MSKRQALVWLAATAAVALTAAGCGTVASGSTAAGTSQADGTQSAGGTPANGSVLLCLDTSAVGPARVTHEHGILPYGFYPGYPMVSVAGQATPGETGIHSAAAQSVPNEPAPGVTTTAATARWLARAVCALPPMTSTLRNCPVMIPDQYMLVFTVHGRQLPAVTVQTTGCSQVTGVGSVRTARQADALLQKLAQLTAGIDNGGPVHRLSAGG